MEPVLSRDARTGETRGQVAVAADTAAVDAAVRAAHATLDALADRPRRAALLRAAAERRRVTRGGADRRGRRGDRARRAPAHRRARPRRLPVPVLRGHRRRRRLPRRGHRRAGSRRRAAAPRAAALEGPARHGRRLRRLQLPVRVQRPRRRHRERPRGRLPGRGQGPSRTTRRPASSPRPPSGTRPGRSGLPADVLTLVHGYQAGADLVRHPLISAVGFTGSIPGGRALFDLAVARPVPIPFYGELGSLNPVLVTEQAAAARAAEIAAALSPPTPSARGSSAPSPAWCSSRRAGRRRADEDGHRDRRGRRPRRAARRADAGALPRRVRRPRRGARRPYPGGGGRRADRRRAAGRPRRACSKWTRPTSAATCSRSASARSPCWSGTATRPTRRPCSSSLGGNLTATLHAEAAEPGAAAWLARLSRFAGRVVFGGWPTGVAVAPGDDPRRPVPGHHHAHDLGRRHRHRPLAPPGHLPDRPAGAAPARAGQAALSEPITRTTGRRTRPNLLRAARLRRVWARRRTLAVMR